MKSDLKQQEIKSWLRDQLFKLVPPQEFHGLKTYD